MIYVLSFGFMYSSSIFHNPDLTAAAGDDNCDGDDDDDDDDDDGAPTSEWQQVQFLQ